MMLVCSNGAPDHSDMEASPSKKKLVSSPQSQLNKLEELNHQSLEEAKEMKFKYGTAEQELTSTRNICRMYEHEHEHELGTSRLEENSQKYIDLDMSNQTQSELWKQQCTVVVERHEKLETEATSMNNLLATDLLEIMDPLRPPGDEPQTSLWQSAASKGYFDSKAISPQSSDLEGLPYNTRRNAVNVLYARKEAGSVFGANSFAIQNKSKESFILDEIEKLKKSSKKVQSIILMLSKGVEHGDCAWTDGNITGGHKVLTGTMSKEKNVDEEHTKMFPSDFELDNSNVKESLHRNIMLIRALKAEKENVDLSNALSSAMSRLNELETQTAEIELVSECLDGEYAMTNAEESLGQVQHCKQGEKQSAESFQGSNRDFELYVVGLRAETNKLKDQLQNLLERHTKLSEKILESGFNSPQKTDSTSQNVKKKPVKLSQSVSKKKCKTECSGSFRIRAIENELRKKRSSCTCIALKNELKTKNTKLAQLSEKIREQRMQLASIKNGALIDRMKTTKKLHELAKEREELKKNMDVLRESILAKERKTRPKSTKDKELETKLRNQIDEIIKLKNRTATLTNYIKEKNKQIRILSKQLELKGKSQENVTTRHTKK